MTQSPLRIFNLVKGKLVEKPIGLEEGQCHPHTFIDGGTQQMNLNDDLKAVCAKLNDAGQAFDVVKVGVGDPMSDKMCDQQIYIAPKGQRHLAQKTLHVAL